MLICVKKREVIIAAEMRYKYKEFLHQSLIWLLRPWESIRSGSLRSDKRRLGRRSQFCLSVNVPRVCPYPNRVDLP